MEATDMNNLEKIDENDETIDMSLTRPSLGSDGDYDDDLEVPDSIKIVDMGNGPVAIENSEDENEGIYVTFFYIINIF